jgi:hypothetical protein
MEDCQVMAAGAGLPGAVAQVTSFVLRKVASMGNMSQDSIDVGLDEPVDDSNMRRQVQGNTHQ